MGNPQKKEIYVKRIPKWEWKELSWVEIEKYGNLE
jgi:hypothetical protein